MFVWKASTLLDCIRRYEPENFAGIEKIGTAWNTPERDAVIAEIFPTLKKISVDFAVMEPASRDPQVRVAAVPMPLSWLDVGSWRMICRRCCNGSSAIHLTGIDWALRGTLRFDYSHRGLELCAGAMDLVISSQLPFPCRLPFPPQSNFALAHPPPSCDKGGTVATDFKVICGRPCGNRL